MQHLEICLPTDLQNYHFQSKLLKLSCSCPTTTKWNTTAVEFLFRFFNNNIWVSSSKVSQKDLPMAAFVIVHVYFTADYGKNLFNISKSWSSCSSTGRHKMKYSWYQERFFCYSKLFCLFSLA